MLTRFRHAAPSPARCLRQLALALGLLPLRSRLRFRTRRPRQRPSPRRPPTARSNTNGTTRCAAAPSRCACICPRRSSRARAFRWWCSRTASADRGAATATLAATSRPTALPACTCSMSAAIARSGSAIRSRSWDACTTPRRSARPSTGCSTCTSRSIVCWQANTRAASMPPTSSSRGTRTARIPPCSRPARASSAMAARSSSAIRATARRS